VELEVVLETMVSSDNLARLLARENFIKKEAQIVKKFMKLEGFYRDYNSPQMNSIISC
jgi:3-methyladenine DNA glycosylase Tag